LTYYLRYSPPSQIFLVKSHPEVLNIDFLVKSISFITSLYTEIIINWSFVLIYNKSVGNFIVNALVLSSTSYYNKNSSEATRKGLMQKLVV